MSIMSPHQSFTSIPLQTGSELRIRNNGEVSVSNPSLETAMSEDTADAVLDYRFDPQTGEHVIRLLTPSIVHPPDERRSR